MVTYRVPSTPSDGSSDELSIDYPSPPLPTPTSTARYELRSRDLPKDGALILLRKAVGSVPRYSLRSPDNFLEDEPFRWPSTAGAGDMSSVEGEDIGRTEDQAASGRTARAAALLNHENLVPVALHRGVEKSGEGPRISCMLETLIKRQARQSVLPTSRKFQGLPESLVWHTLISLLRAVTYMHTGLGGFEYRTQERKLGWQPIVHNFINPNNIFFSRTIDRRGTATHARCQLGNFSRCIVLPYDPRVVDDGEARAQRRNAFQALHDIGEETGYEAPEIVGDVADIPGPSSDLWSIGAVMVAMMTGTHVWDFLLEIRFLEHLKQGAKRSEISERWRNVSLTARRALLLTIAGDASIALALPSRYSKALRMLAEALLFVAPESRLSAREVLLDAEARWEMRKPELQDGRLEVAKAIAQYQEEAKLARQMLDEY